MAWVHLATAPDQVTADIWASKLDAFGINVILVPSHTVYYSGRGLAGVRLQVLEEDVEAARELIEGEEEEEWLADP